MQKAATLEQEATAQRPPSGAGTQKSLAGTHSAARDEVDHALLQKLFQMMARLGSLPSPDNTQAR